MNMKKKAAAACVAVMAAVSLPMGIVPVQPVQADLITDVIGGLQVKSALSKQIKHYDTTKEGQNEIYQAVTKRTGVLDNEYYNERLASIMNRLSHSIAQTDSSIKTLPYRWYVSPDKTFNAACTMGHVMIVNKGMFDLVSNDDEIAVVLGHEMGHGQKHHVANSTQKKVNVEIGKMVLADTIGGSGLNNLILNTITTRSRRSTSTGLPNGKRTTCPSVISPGPAIIPARRPPSGSGSWKNMATTRATSSGKSSRRRIIRPIRNGATVTPRSSMK